MTRDDHPFRDVEVHARRTPWEGEVPETPSPTSLAGSQPSNSPSSYGSGIESPGSPYQGPPSHHSSDPSSHHSSDPSSHSSPHTPHSHSSPETFMIHEGAQDTSHSPSSYDYSGGSTPSDLSTKRTPMGLQRPFASDDNLNEYSQVSNNLNN